jgi:hypothetical protein
VFEGKLQAQSARHSRPSTSAAGRTAGRIAGSATMGAIYDEKVGKLLNLAIGAGTDSEALAAFEKARQLHVKEVAA